MPEANASQPEDEKPPEAERRRKKLIVWPIAAAAVVCLAVVALVVALILRAVIPPRPPVGIPLQITRISGVSPLPTVPAPVVEVGDTRVSMPLPLALEVGTRTLPIRSTDPGDGAWAGSSGDPDSAVWVYGTVVNYVVGVGATPDNRALVDALREDDPILLRLSSGTRLVFRVAQKETVRPDDPAIFAQSHPGLTLVLLGEGETERTVVLADFDRAEEVTPQPSGPAAGVGQSVQVGDVQVIVHEGHAERGGANLAPGTMLYLVEFSVQNTGDSARDAAALSAELVDGAGNTYLPSASAAAQGRYGPMDGQIAPGEQVNGTAGYVVPEGMVGPSVTWVLAPQPSSELRARFTIPYAPPVMAPAWPEVRVLQAFLGEGGDVLHVVAEVHNAGSSTLTVTADDIRLSSSAGPGELQMAAPPFPWSVDGTESRQVELHFARPEASSCVVTILDYTFEISGMP